MPAPKAKVGVIGGSGLYGMAEVKRAREVAVRTPFGAPSDKVVLGELKGVKVAFLPRHGKGHRLLPGEINQRANIWALKSLGVEQVLSLSAVGSLRQNLPPRTFVFPENLVDRTKGRPSTFFGGGVVAHVPLAHPFCSELSALLFAGARRLKIPSSRGGVYCCMEGPAFSTRAESEFHRGQGFDIIGMTVSPEAKLAREAELCYAPVAMVTDYDCWKEGEELDNGELLAHLTSNVANAKKLLLAAVEAVARRKRGCACGRSLAGAVYTSPELIPAAARRRVGIFIDKYLPKGKRR